MSTPIQNVKKDIDYKRVHKSRYDTWVSYAKQGKTIKETAEILNIHWQTLRDSIKKVLEYEKV